MAAAFDLVTFDGHSIGPATVYEFYLHEDDDIIVSGELALTSRRSAGPLVEGTSSPGRMIVIQSQGPVNDDAGAAAYRTNIDQWFDPARNADGPRYLVRYADDGTTEIRIPCYVTEKRFTGRGANAYVIALFSPQDHWEAATADTSSSNPATVTNGGNARAIPTLTLTTATHGTLRPTTVSGTGNGGGLTNYPVVAALSDTAATATNVWVFIRGVPVPCWVDDGGAATSRVWFLCDTHSDGSDTDVAIIYASGITNPLCGALSDGGMLWTGTGESDNSTWRWDDWAATSHPNRVGSWVPSVAGRHVASEMSYGIAAEAASGITLALYDVDGAYPNDADSLTLAIGARAGATNALTNLSRVVSAGGSSGTYLAYLRYRKADSTAWTTIWSYNGLGTTVTTSVDIDDAVEVMAGLEFTVADPGGGVSSNPTLAISSAGSGTSNATLALAGTPTVTVGAAENMDVFDGDYTIGNYTLAFDAVFVPDGTFTIDCATGDMTSSTGERWYGDVVPSDPDVILALEPGVSTVTDGLSATDQLSWRAAYA